MGPGPIDHKSPVMGFVTLLTMVNCGSICVCVVGLRGFHHQEKSTLASLCWPEEKTLTSLSLNVGRRDHHGLSGYMLVFID
jgi:hypothetical protein